MVPALELTISHVTLYIAAVITSVKCKLGHVSFLVKNQCLPIVFWEKNLHFFLWSVKSGIIWPLSISLTSSYAIIPFFIMSQPPTVVFHFFEKLHYFLPESPCTCYSDWLECSSFCSLHDWFVLILQFQLKGHHREVFLNHCTYKAVRSQSFHSCVTW